MSAGYGDADRGRSGERAGYPGNHHTINAGLPAGRHLLEPPSEDAGITTLEPYDHRPLPRPIDQHGADPLLRNTVTSGLLAGVDDLGAGSSLGQQFMTDQTIVHDQIRSAQQIESADRD